jgi:hypothetical protein
MAPIVRSRTKAATAELAPAAQLDSFLGKFSPDTARLAKAVLTTMRARLPGAVELVYAKSNSLVVGFCPSERASDVINSIAVYTNWVNLYFFEGGTLPDPGHMLQGTGHTVRHIKITSAADLDTPAVRALMAETLKRADPPLDPKAKRRIIIKSIAKWKPRRP